jgi:hypothetical protein
MHWMHWPLARQAKVDHEFQGGVPEDRCVIVTNLPLSTVVKLVGYGHAHK